VITISATGGAGGPESIIGWTNVRPCNSGKGQRSVLYK